MKHISKSVIKNIRLTIGKSLWRQFKPRRIDMLFTLKWLAKIFNENEGELNDSIPIHDVTTDSRKKVNNGLFIPLVGERFDGHDYILDAFNNGAIAALWKRDRTRPEALPNDFPIYYVSDTLDALQRLAACYREKINPTVIAITGSNGKTTTKDMIGSVLTTSYRTHRTMGNFNNHIGLPLTILDMPPDTEILVLEMGMNDFGEISHLSHIAQPDIAVITNIGESHLAQLRSRAGIAKAKLEIVDGMSPEGYLYIDGDEPLLKNAHVHPNVITCGFYANNDVIIEDTKIEDDKTLFGLSDGKTYSIPLLGKHHALNALFAVTIGTKMGVMPKTIQQALAKLEHTSMRFEIVQGKNGATIINDAYNASPTSMKAAIDVVKQMRGYK